ncbi:hypothetical protein niasHT_003558 [Heterodera trifolii]|uniref:Uncharacterized protein n=1 Tax=Heterodera trifolii TaxID=157864 RepID=A0ABD2LYA7_9BILA
MTLWHCQQLPIAKCWQSQWHGDRPFRNLFYCQRPKVSNGRCAEGISGHSKSLRICHSFSPTASAHAQLIAFVTLRTLRTKCEGDGMPRLSKGTEGQIKLIWQTDALQQQMARQTDGAKSNRNHRGFVP